MNRLDHDRRNGFGSIWAIVVLSVLTALATGLTFQLLSARQAVDRRQNQVQALWLARSGEELAAARLLANPTGYEGETVELIPGSKVRIEVKAEKDSPNTYLVTSETRYPAEGTESVVRSVTRRFRRVVENDRARLEVLTSPAPSSKASP